MGAPPPPLPSTPHERAMPLLRPPRKSADSIDLVHSFDPAAVVLARPRPEIILRWKRFLILMMLFMVLIAGVTVTLYYGIDAHSVFAPSSDADSVDDRIEILNTYTGILMGFLESFMSLLLGYLFPVFTVYLHNVPWYPGDDPATRTVSRVKKVMLLLFFPIVMIAVGNSLSAVQANNDTVAGPQSEATTGTSDTKARMRLLQAAMASDYHALDDSVLRSLGRGRTPLAVAKDSSAACPDLPEELRGIQWPRLAGLTRVTAAFPLREWSRVIDIVGVDAQASVTVTTKAASSHDEQDIRKAAEAVSPRMAMELSVQGFTMFQEMARESGVNVNQTVLMAAQDWMHSLLLSGSDTAKFQEVIQQVSDTFQHGLEGLGTDAMSVTFQRHTIDSQLGFETMTMTVPLRASSLAHVSMCGSESCLSLETDPLLRLRKQLALSKYEYPCSSGTCTEATDAAAFLYGFTVLADQSLQWTFGKLSWAFQHGLELCTADSPSQVAGHGDGRNDACRGLTLSLPQVSRHLVVNAEMLPASLASTDLRHPIRLLQLLEPPVRGKAINGVATLHVTANTNPTSGAASPCVAARVDTYARFVQENHLFLQDSVSNMYSTALLFLFQDAVLLPPAETAMMAWSRHLQESQFVNRKIFVTNTPFGRISAWVACGILFVLSMLVLVLPNARARLEPPKGGNARAERFVAVQTEEVYPNLIYKKRFRIGKTGEKIKFREFAVESVSLHHRMEEDTQIYL